MSAAVIRWEEPPPARTGRQAATVDHEAVAATLRERPGVWALIAIAPAHSGMATHIITGRIASYRPAGAFDARRRAVDGEQRIYCRFLGEAGS